jgi:hypothetical protein
LEGVFVNTNNWKETLGKLAPTVATALLGPLGGAAVSAIGSILGLDGATQTQIKEAIESGQLTPEHVAELRKLELQYQNEEKERGFKYADLEFRDRASARQANVDGGTHKMQFWLSLVLLTVTLGSEIAVLFVGYPTTVEDIVVGRVLGLMDSVALMVLAYHYGSSSGSAQKTELLSQANPIK